MKKIIYLIEQPLDERNFDRFGIQNWIDRNWHTEVWDLTPWSYPHVWRNFLDSKRKLKDFAQYFPIASRNELKARYSALGPINHFIDLTGDNYRSFVVKRSLMRRGAVRVMCAPGSIPVPQAVERNRLLSRIRSIFARGPIKSMKFLGAACASRLAGQWVTPGLAIVSGSKSILTVRDSREVLKVHSFDYDIYLQVAKRCTPPDRQYAVFIDQDLCFHPDFGYQNAPFVVTADKYFPAVCNALGHMARCLNLEIRIAAHPRSSYEQRTLDCFPGLPVIRGRTAELIGASTLVICHDSTAIHFAVLFGKPMVFVTTDELIPTFEGRSIAGAAAEFGKIPINVDKDLQGVDWPEQLRVDPAKYVAYRNNYIKIDGTPDRPLWNVVIDHIEKSDHPKSAQFQAGCAAAVGE